jgi:hypothetical protein
MGVRASMAHGCLFTDRAHWRTYIPQTSRAPAGVAATAAAVGLVLGLLPVSGPLFRPRLSARWGSHVYLTLTVPDLGRWHRDIVSNASSLVMSGLGSSGPHGRSSQRATCRTCVDNSRTHPARERARTAHSHVHATRVRNPTYPPSPRPQQQLRRPSRPRNISLRRPGPRRGNSRGDNEPRPAHLLLQTSLAVVARPGRPLK